MGECDQFDVEWFVANWSLQNTWRDVLLVTSTNVSIENINEFFGRKVNKNEWKYDDWPNEDVMKKITQIYWRVTEKQKVMDKQLLITFAKAIITKARASPWIGQGLVLIQWNNNFCWRKPSNSQQKFLLNWRKTRHHPNLH
jgi:hypothetical protein